MKANVFISNGSLETELGKHVGNFVELLKDRNDETLLLKHFVIEGSHESAFPMTALKSVKWLAELMKEGRY